MKINFLKFKKEKHFEKENFKINPNIFWRIILGVFLLLVLAVSFFGFYLFTQSNKEADVPSENVGGPAAKARKDRIDSILKYFDERGKTSNDILSLPSEVVDPSL